MNKIKLYWDILSPTFSIVFIGSVIFFTLGMLLSIPMCLLWNWLMPYIFGLPKLTLLESFGLSILISLLSPRKLDFSKKSTSKKVEETVDEEYEKLNKNLEDLLKDLSSQFRA
tara:strand:+ start:201 stop:539 length:339 start_codon:yes stop_codon:yes gene_type:complete